MGGGRDAWHWDRAPGIEAVLGAGSRGSLRRPWHLLFRGTRGPPQSPAHPVTIQARRCTEVIPGPPGRRHGWAEIHSAAPTPPKEDPRSWPAHGALDALAAEIKRRQPDRAIAARLANEQTRWKPLRNTKFRRVRPAPRPANASITSDSTCTRRRCHRPVTWGQRARCLPVHEKPREIPRLLAARVGTIVSMPPLHSLAWSEISGRILWNTSPPKWASAAPHQKPQPWTGLIQHCASISPGSAGCGMPIHRTPGTLAPFDE